MTTIALTREFASLRSRSQKTMFVSLAVHTAALIWIAFAPRAQILPDPYFEITWLEMETIVAPDLESEPNETQPLETAVAPSSEAEDRSAPVDPPSPERTIETLAASRDEVAATLTARRPVARTQRALAVAPESGSRLQRSVLATMAAPAARPVPADLKREATGTGGAGTLRRDDPGGRRAAPAAARITAAIAGGTGPAVQNTAAATRELGNATLAGPVADRALLVSTLPVYPEWAKTQAVEATVTLEFRVMPDGRVKENIQVQKTAGYRDFDRNATAAIATWIFAPLTGGAAGEQWGTITFRYRLDEGRKRSDGSGQ